MNRLALAFAVGAIAVIGWLAGIAKLMSAHVPPIVAALISVAVTASVLALVLLVLFPNGRKR